MALSEDINRDSRSSLVGPLFSWVLMVYKTIGIAGTTESTIGVYSNVMVKHNRVCVLEGGGQIVISKIPRAIFWFN